jgi:Zn-dependent M32 family carboxypeptidase
MLKNISRLEEAFKCVLKQEYRILITDVKKYSKIQHLDENLIKEIQKFLQRIRTIRRELIREILRLKCTCTRTKPKSNNNAKRINEIERIVERIEEIDNKFMDLMYKEKTNY